MKMKINKFVGASVMIAAMGTAGVTQSQDCSNPGTTFDAAASYVGYATDECADSSTGPCSELYSDALVNCYVALGDCCQNDGTQIANVENMLYTGVCDGNDNCILGGQPTINVVTRCEKETISGCYLAMSGAVRAL